jgi:hypothetical protein
VLQQAGQAGSIAVGETFTDVPSRVLEVQAARRGEGVVDTMATLVNRSVQSASDDIDEELGRIVDQGVDNETVAEDIARILARGNPDLQETLKQMGRGTGVDVDPEADPVALDEEDLSQARRLEYEARRIAVSETNSHYHEADVVSAIQSPVVDLVRWRTSQLHTREKRYVPDVCDFLEQADLFGYGEGLYHPAGVPALVHPHCVVPGTQIQASCSRAVRSKYSGKVVKITTCEGNELTVTPNHPIPTIDRGWTGASRLREGDQLLSYRGNRNVGPLEGKDVSDSPIAAEKAFHSIAEDTPSFSVQVSAKHLHGDGRGVNGNVDVVGADSALLRYGKALRSKLGGESIFVTAKRSAALLCGILNSLGAVQQLLTAECLPTSSFMRWADQFISSTLGFDTLPPAFLGLRSATNVDTPIFETRFQGGSVSIDFSGKRLHRLAFLVALRKFIEVLNVDPFLLGGGADLDISRFESPFDRAASDPEFASNIDLRSSGSVLVDDIVDIEIMRHDGYVYDFESVSGCMIANNLLVSNCQCRVENVMKPPEEYGTSNRALPDKRELSETTVGEALREMEGERTVTEKYAQRQAEALNRHLSSAFEAGRRMMQ